jgi:sulfur dioxygenase
MSSTPPYPVLSKRQLAEILHPFVIDVRKSEDVVEFPPSEIVPRFRINDWNVPRECVHISFDAATKSLLASEESKLPSDKDIPIIVLCYRGNRASLMCELLTDMGYNNLYNGKNLAYLQAAFSSDGNMTLRQMFDRESCTYTYLLMDNATKSAVLIDPVLELVDRDMEELNNLDATLKYVLNTHVHADHITGSGVMKAKYAEQGVTVKSIISKESGAKADKLVSSGDIIYFGEQTLEVRNTPGHTPGCVSYILNQKSHVFCGDTILVGGCGRTDFQGGDAGLLFESVWEELFALPDTTVLYPGHDYKGRTCSTIGEQKRLNSRLTKPKDEFVALMRKLFDGSNYPQKLDVSLPANLVCGNI